MVSVSKSQYNTSERLYVDEGRLTTKYCLGNVKIWYHGSQAESVFKVCMDRAWHTWIPTEYAL